MTPRVRFPVVASVAKAYRSDAFFHCAAKNIQILDRGIGFTWEDPAHLYSEARHESRLLFGAPAHHRELEPSGCLVRYDTAPQDQQPPPEHGQGTRTA